MADVMADIHDLEVMLDIPRRADSAKNPPAAAAAATSSAWADHLKGAPAKQWSPVDPRVSFFPARCPDHS